MTVVTDENGNVIDELKIKNAEIIASLAEVLQDFIEKDALDKKNKRILAFSYCSLLRMS